MTYNVEGVFSTNWRMALMLSECATVRELLGAANAAAALAKITTYSEDDMPVPRVLVHQEGNEIRLKSDSIEAFVEAEHRLIGCEFQIYIPDDDDDITRITDEHNFVMDKMGDVLSEMLTLSGTGNPLPGTTHLKIYDPVLYMPNRASFDDRFDTEEMEKGDTARALWFVLLAFEVH
jgi:hypothetical protein